MTIAAFISPAHIDLGHQVKIFICWSSLRGLRVAEALETWLNDVFETRIETQVSSGIDKGVLWREELQRDLDESQVGLLCITPEALHSQWVNYEAGMLARGLGVISPSERGTPGNSNRRLFTFLLGVRASELDGPLAAFQSADGMDKADTRRLVHALCAALPQDESTGALLKYIDESWCILWQRLIDRFSMIPKLALTEVWPEFATLFRRKTFEEPIADCVSQDWLARYNGARETAAEIAARAPTVKSACRRFVVELLRDLESALDGYAMAVSRLIGHEPFGIDCGGKLEIDPKGLGVACERWRARVLHLVMRIADPGQAPFFDESAHFERLEEFTERENLVHRMMPLVRDFAALVERLPVPNANEPVGDSAGAAPGIANSVVPEKCPVATKSLRYWPEPAACFRLVSDALRADLAPTPLMLARKVDVEVQFRTTDWDFDRIMYGVYVKERIRFHPASDALAQTVIEFAEIALERARLRHACLGSNASSGAPAVPVGSPATMQLWFALDALEALTPAALSSMSCVELQSRVGKLSQKVLDFAKRLQPVHELLNEQAQELLQRWRPIDAACVAMPQLESERLVTQPMAS